MADGNDLARAGFAAISEASADDWRMPGDTGPAFRAKLPDRLMAQLRLLADDHGGFRVDRLEHSLQTASRAQRDGRDEEYVVCALLHDIGDGLGPTHHADIAAVILKPFVSDANHWMLLNHGMFQDYCFYQIGRDRRMRDRYRGHPHFEHTAQFCHLYDQAAFDPTYPSPPLDAFEPMLRRVLAAPRRSSDRR